VNICGCLYYGLVSVFINELKMISFIGDGITSATSYTQLMKLTKHFTPLAFRIQTN